MIHKNSDLKISWAPFLPHQEQTKRWEKIRGNDPKNVSLIVPALVSKQLIQLPAACLDKLGFKSNQA